MKKNTIKLMLALVVVGTITGCTPNSPEPSVKQCVMPSGYNLNSAVDVGVIAVKQCPSRYHEIMDKLMDIASNDKAVSNRDKLWKVTEAGINSGLLPKDRSKSYFRRFFKEDFESIPSEEGPVGTFCPKKEKIIKNMYAELNQKSRGFIEVMGDPAGYKKAERAIYNFEQSFETICMRYDDGKTGY